MQTSPLWLAVSAATSLLLAGCGGISEDDYDVDTNDGMIRWYYEDSLQDEFFSPTNGTYLVDRRGVLDDEPSGYLITRINHNGAIDLSHRVNIADISLPEKALIGAGTQDESVSISTMTGRNNGIFEGAYTYLYRVADGSTIEFSQDISAYQIATDVPYKLEPANKNGVMYYTNIDGGWAISADAVMPADTVPLTEPTFTYNPPPMPAGYSFTDKGFTYKNKEFRLYYFYKADEFRQYREAYLSVYEIGNPDALWHSPIDVVSDRLGRGIQKITDDRIYLATQADQNGCSGTVFNYNATGLTARQKVACHFSVNVVTDHFDLYGVALNREPTGTSLDQKRLIQHRDVNDNVINEYYLSPRGSGFSGDIFNFEKLDNGKVAIVIHNTRNSSGSDTPWNADSDLSNASDVWVLNSDMTLYAHFPFHEYRHITRDSWMQSRSITMEGSTNGYDIFDVNMSATGDVYFSGKFVVRDFELGRTRLTDRFGVVH